MRALFFLKQNNNNALSGGGIILYILTTGRYIAVCVDEKDVVNGVEHYYVMRGGQIYDPENGFRNLKNAHSGAYLQSTAAIKEFHSLLPKTKDEYDKLTTRFDAQRELKVKSKETDKFESAIVEAFAKSIAEFKADDIIDKVIPSVRDKIIEEFGIIPQKHEVVCGEEKHEITGVTHEMFDTVLQLVADSIPVFMTGAAGTGKNVICRQVAESLGLDFYFSNAVTQEYKLTGFIDANGRFHETQFYKAFAGGGLFFLDEMDASVPEVLIMLNAAIANGYFDFPIGKVEAHKDFRVIAAGNTFGTGADVEYTGRYQLDAASLDRFALVEIDYSPRIEAALANGDTELVDFIHAFRNAVKEAGLRHLATYRSIERIAKLSHRMEIPTVLRISLLKNLRIDDLHIITDQVNKIFKGRHNRYAAAMSQVG